MRFGLPVAKPGQVIGLFGGSFDPAHQGHVDLTRAALTRLGLDQIWWLVTPANPLKSRGPAPLAKRMTDARAVMQHPRVKITCLEVDLGTSITADTIAALKARYPAVRFVWIMGSDNLAGFHHWNDWKSIMMTVPVAVLARPGSRLRARLSRAAKVFGFARVRAGRDLLAADLPAWTFLNMPLNDVSSTELRHARAAAMPKIVG